MDMNRIRCSDGVRLAVYDWGDKYDPVPIVLYHGFAASAKSNWVAPGIVRALAEARRVVAFDARGHGASDAPVTAESYLRARLAQDVIELADALGLTRYDIAGYSMGGFVAVISAVRDPRTRRLALCGCCEQLFVDHSSSPTYSQVADAIRAVAADSVSDPTARAFRRAVDASGADRFALAACYEGMTGRHWQMSGDAIPKLRLPTMVIGGRDDRVMVGLERLTGVIPNAEMVWVNGDHLTAVRDSAFALELVRFFASG